MTPQSSESDFSAIRLGFEADDLRVMEFSDRLAQATRIDLSGISINPEIEPATFTFEAPDGVDVIGDGMF